MDQRELDCIPDVRSESDDWLIVSAHETGFWVNYASYWTERLPLQKFYWLFRSLRSIEHLMHHINCSSAPHPFEHVDRIH